MGTLSDLLTGNVVASHMPFDRIAIQSAIAMHSLASVECFWLDTAVVARRVWPRFAKRGYGLKTLATWCGIEFRHHNAVEDAIAAGLIFSRALEDSGKDIEEWIAHPFTSKFDADPTLSDKRKAQRWDPAMWGTENKIDAFLSTDAKKRGV
jgi:DNA polymerase III epsilon subunit-like protein